jgi:hypothetical protein
VQKSNKLSKPQVAIEIVFRPKVCNLSNKMVLNPDFPNQQYPKGKARQEID